MKNQKVFSVIMAGGIGSRFWPMSTEEMPKQFHDVLGTGRSLLQSTVDRLLNVSAIEQIIIVTSKQYKEIITKQLPNLPTENILCEPSRKNTAPCIAFAAKFIKERCTDAKMLVAPADHIILNEIEFVDTIKIALESADSKNLITLGIQPSRPDTGYGYINFEKEEENPLKSVRTVNKFTEKPNLNLAHKFIESGNYLWNSGIFIWSVDAILYNFKKHLNEVFTLFDKVTDVSASIEDIYKKCPSVSVDYGIMEHAETVKVVLSEFAWSDLGTWGSLYTHINLDSNNNASQGEIYTVNCKDSLLKISNPKKKAIIKGLEDYIVVDTNAALLICPKEEEQTIKTMLADSGY